MLLGNRQGKKAFEHRKTAYAKTHRSKIICYFHPLFSSAIFRELKVLGEVKKAFWEVKGLKKNKVKIVARDQS